MKLWPLAFLAVGLYGFIVPQAVKRQTLVLYGDTRGYLSPCGCTSPMSGGIRRAATVIRRLQHQGAVFVAPGNNVEDVSRQSELKGEAFAEASASMHVSALGFGELDSALGQGEALQMDQLSEGKLLSSDLASSATNTLNEQLSTGDFLVGSISQYPGRVALNLQQTEKSNKSAISQLLNDAKDQNRSAILLSDFELPQAKKIARDFPGLSLITYHSNGDPPPNLIFIRNTALATSGSHGKQVIAISFQDGTATAYERMALGPDIPDDNAVTSIYFGYLKRVDSENLLARLPRWKTHLYAGSDTCASCHEKAYHTWMHSGHSRALSDLEAQRHGRDPDCVGCHVVGLQSTSGFKSRIITPRLANVGCESCHGPALLHVQAPRKWRLQTVSQKACITCHTTDNSPGFSFPLYWRKIRH